MNRKDEHVSLAKAFHDKQKNEFDFVRIIHNPLPQIAVSDVDLSTQAVGFTLSSPFYINAMTGGSEKTKKINQDLAIVAYKQPITRAEIEQIRGVQVSGAVQRLAAHKLIEEKGRVEGPGRPILYGTTGYFLDYFGLKSLEELPDTQEMEISLEEDVSPDLFFDGMNKGE